MTSISHLDAGLVACALLVILAIVGIALWLIGAGHLDQIERPDEDPCRAPAPRHGSGARRAAPRRAPHSRTEVRRNIADHYRGGKWR